MFKVIRINRKYFILLILLFLISNLYTLTFLSHTYLNIDDDNKISDQITTEPVSLKSSSTIESTRITKESQYTTDFIVNMPSVRPDGDLYIAQIAMDDIALFSSVPSGWTEIENGFQGFDVRFATYWKIGSSEPATYTWGSSTSRLWVGAIHRISGFNPNTPIHKSKISTGLSKNPIAPSVNTTVNECLILRMLVAVGNKTVPIYWPSGTTPIFQDDCGSVMSAAAYHTQSLAGNTDTALFTIGAAGRWVTITIAIKPKAENIPPIYSNLIESADPLELGETETIRINTSDPSGINQVLIEFEGSNHSMRYISGDMWQYDAWIPSSIGSKSYTIWMEDNNNNWNSISGSIMVMDGNNEFMLFLIIGIIFASAIGLVTTIVIVKRKYQKDSLPRRKKIPLKIILSHINNISNSSQVSETTKIQKVKKQKENNKAAPQKETINDEELMARINKIKIYGEKLFTEGAYLESQKQYEFAEKILVKLGKKEEALLFSDLTIGIKELSEERDKKLEILEEEKLGNDSLKIFDLYYDLIELSKKLNDYDSADMYLSELTQFYQMDQKKLRDLEYQRFDLYKQANSLLSENIFEKSAEFYEKCKKISQFLVQIGRDNEKNNVKKFREKINECLSKATQKYIKGVD